MTIKNAVEQENYDPSLKNQITSIWGILKYLYFSVSSIRKYKKVKLHYRNSEEKKVSSL